MSAQIDRIMKAISGGIALACSEVALEVTHNLVVATPVKTGWASSNWVPTIGVPFAGTVGAPPTLAGRVDHALARKGAAPGAHRGSGNAAREGATGSLLKYELGQGSIFVTNNVPYITGPGSLDDGHSKQAPRGFIRKAIIDGVNTVASRREGRDVAV